MTKNNPKFSATDIFIILFFIFFAGICHFGRVSGNAGKLLISSDAEAIASFAAARDHPECFAGDVFLGNKKNVNSYFTVHMPLISAIAKLNKDYVSSFLSIMGIHIFLSLLGFYWLGRFLFQDRYWALLLAIAETMFVPLAIGDFWGIYFEPLPRVSFHVLLPCILIAALDWQFKPFLWPLLFIFLGLTMYVHPLSTVCWVVAIWLGLWICQRPSWKIRFRLFYMLLLGIIFLIAAVPFILNFMDNYQLGANIPYEVIKESIEYRLSKGLRNPLYGFRSFFYNIAFVRVLIFGISGAIFIFLFQKKERKRIALIGLWFLSILVASLGIPLLTYLIALKSQTMSIGMEFVRNIKYIFPLLLIFCIWPFAVIIKNSKNQRNRRLVFVMGSILVILWSGRQMYKHIIMLDRNGCFIFSRQKQEVNKKIDMLEAIKRLTSRDSRILNFSSISEPTIRSYSLRPLAYATKEGTHYAFFNDAEAAVKWHKETKVLQGFYESFDIEKNEKIKIASLFNLAQQFNARFLLLSRHSPMGTIISISRDEVVYYNDSYLLLKIDKANAKNLR